MTQQEQFHRPYDETTAMPGPRSGDHDDHEGHDHDPDDVAVGTAHAPNHEEPLDDEAEQAYPAGTYASGSSDADVDADGRDDAEVVDHDDALAFDANANANANANADAGRDTDAVYEDADRAGDHGAVTAEDAAAGERLDADGGVEDEREEEVVARTEEAEDADWQSEHLEDGARDESAGDYDARPVVSDADVSSEDAPVAGVVGEGAEGGADAAGDGGAVGSRPGSVDVAAVGAIWTDGAVDGLRERWRALQLRFIDDPSAVAGEADSLVGEAVDTITNALQAQRRELAAWQGDGGDDTERLRAAVRAYRDYLDRLLGM